MGFEYTNFLLPALDGVGAAGLSGEEWQMVPNTTGVIVIGWSNVLTADLFYDVQFNWEPLPGYV